MEKSTPEFKGTLETLHREWVRDEDGMPFELVFLREDTGQLWLMRSIGGDVYEWDPDAAAAALDEG